MSYGFLDIAMTPAVKRAQADNGAAGVYEDFKGDRAFDRFDENAAAFIAQRDSFYIASLSESGWPYVQHRGGPKGFLKLIDDRTLGFLDYRGNRQYITLGNTSVDDRVALFFMDYRRRKRMKMFAHLSVHSLEENPELAQQLVDPEYGADAERAMVLKLVTYDWNCPQHIVQRFDKDEVRAAAASLEERVALLEAENARLRGRAGN